MLDPSLPKREKVPDREVLEALLDQALQVPGESGAANPVDLDALKAVVRRHRGKSFALEPIAVEMVQALLECYFKNWGSSGEAWTGMSLEIARILFEDPAGHERMERIWNHLVGST